MSFETSAERKLAVDGLDTAVLNFVKRSRVIANEATGYVTAIQQTIADTTNAKATTDALLVDDPSNSILLAESAAQGAKIAEANVVLTQAQSIATAIAALV